ncbi:MAG: lipopolysaccharide transport system permease protein [Chthoniobacter sp.]|jgi:lipopolysaccharide transport system permease protein|nr:lipopolysaccharide transport system permease protein [Chthoniobacter sp.]
MSQSTLQENFEIVIEPNRGWMRIDWRALWAYRDLLLLLVRREFLSKYKQTVLGPAWFVINPLLTTIVFTVVFGKVAHISTDGIPPVLFYLCGLLGWNYFSQVVTTGAATFQSHSALFSKVYFPRLTVPLSVAIATLCAFALQAVTFAGFYLYYKLCTPEAAGLAPGWRIVFLPLLVLQIGALSLGVTLWMSAATAKYRDLLQLNQFIMQLWMYATPIIYPVSKIPGKWLWLVWLNPMSTIIESFRICIFGQGTVNPMYVVGSVALTAAIFLSGIMFYQKTERTVADIA